MVDNYQTGLLIAPRNIADLAERTEYLATNDKRRKEFEFAGRNKLETEYSWQKIAANLEDTYLELNWMVLASTDRLLNSDTAQQE